MPPDPTYLAYRAGSALARLLPQVVVRPAAGALGLLAAATMSDRRRMVARHQQRVRPELSGLSLGRAVHRTFAFYARYWLESFRLPGTSAKVLDGRLRIEGWEHIQAGLNRGTGVILALPHLGGWEWGGFWLSAVRQLCVSVVVEPVQPPELAKWFIGLRRQFGMEVIALGPDAGSRVARALKANHIVCLLCDRDLSGDGIAVEFFGERTTLPAGPAMLALRSGAPLLPSATYFQGDRHVGVVRAPIDTARGGRLRVDVARVTAELATELEGLIRRAPEQWHLLQPNWPSDGEGHDRLPLSADGR